tara:strand:+ start:5302 stop:5502 length:201 start_codon:yes stop_codon:yes gene_type:complete
MQEVPISEDMHLITTDEGAQLIAAATLRWELRWWILPHKGSIVVPQPKKLHSDIIAGLKTGVELYV